MTNIVTHPALANPGDLDRLAQLEALAKTCATEIKAIKQRLYPQLAALNKADRKIERNGVVFEYQASQRWKYPKQVEAQIKMVQLTAQTSGEADLVDGHRLIVKVQPVSVELLNTLAFNSDRVRRVS